MLRGPVGNQRDKKSPGMAGGDFYQDVEKRSEDGQMQGARRNDADGPPQ
jgi:hypothetical protein